MSEWVENADGSRTKIKNGVKQTVYPDGSRWVRGGNGDFFEMPPVKNGPWRKALVTAGLLKED